MGEERRRNAKNKRPMRVSEKNYNVHVHCFCRSFKTYEGLHYSLVSFSMFGFVFFDLLYIAVVINYASQCQLLTFYIENIKDKVLNKQYKTLSSALKVGSLFMFAFFSIFQFLSSSFFNRKYIMCMNF